MFGWFKKKPKRDICDSLGHTMTIEGREMCVVPMFIDHTTEKVFMLSGLDMVEIPYHTLIHLVEHKATPADIPATVNRVLVDWSYNLGFVKRQSKGSLYEHQITTPASGTTEIVLRRLPGN